MWQQIVDLDTAWEWYKAKLQLADIWYLKDFGNFCEYLKEVLHYRIV